jgi:hypothetical protein
LDKYKFLPLHADAARRFPDAKYTVSVEADTFLFWNQLVKWLKERDREGKGADELKMWGNGNLLSVSTALLPQTKQHESCGRSPPWPVLLTSGGLSLW